MYVSVHHPGTDLYGLVWVERVSDRLHLSDQTHAPASFHFYKCQRFLQALQAKPSSRKAGWMHPGHKDHPVTKAVHIITPCFLSSSTADFVMMQFCIATWTISPPHPQPDPWAADKLVGRTLSVRKAWLQSHYSLDLSIIPSTFPSITQMGKY